MKVRTVALATYPNEMEARMIAQILEDNEIPAYVKPLGGGYGGLGVTQFIHHRVYVQDKDLEEAKELLGIDQEESTEEDFQETSAP